MARGGGKTGGSNHSIVPGKSRTAINGAHFPRPHMVAPGPQSTSFAGSDVVTGYQPYTWNSGVGDEVDYTQWGSTGTVGSNTPNTNVPGVMDSREYQFKSHEAEMIQTRGKVGTPKPRAATPSQRGHK